MEITWKYRELSYDQSATVAVDLVNIILKLIDNQPTTHFFKSMRNCDGING
jgi:hypothetical protein